MGALVPFPGPDDPRRGAGGEPSDRDLVLAARAGHADAKERLYRRHVDMVLGMLFRLLARDRDSDDLAQEVFLRAFERLDQLGDPQAFAAWLGSITVRSAHEFLRRRGLRRALGLERPAPVDLDTVVSAQASPEVQVELRGLYRVLEALPAGVRIALVLRRVEGLTIDEIALQMRVSPATVKRRILAGERALTKHLQRGEETSGTRGDRWQDGRESGR